MDSKVRKLTIAVVFSLMLLVFALVIYLNRSQFQRSQSSPAAEMQVEEGTDGTETFEGKQIGNDLTAFLQDEEFFDVPKTKYQEYMEQKNTLSLITTSVEKDLRIKIINFDGNVVQGVGFTVSIQDKGKYEDTDQDGIIYVGNLKAGDYMVSLEPQEGYTVPETPVRVNVKEQVEYVAIEDISMLIKTEDEIDPEKEDTGEWDAAEDADRTEIKKLQRPSENARLGIDVSKWNKDIDWEKVKEAGVEFAIIRCGYRGSSTGSLVIDPYYEQNIRGAEAAGIDVGVYFFTQAVNEVEAVEEASMVLSLIQRQYLTYPVFIDTEGAGGNGRADKLDKDMRTRVCAAFCSTIENAGYGSGVYASKNWMNNNLKMDELEQYAVWLAEYRSIPTYEGYYNMWQYTSKGKVDGIEGNVDLNASYLEPGMSLQKEEP